MSFNSINCFKSRKKINFRTLCGFWTITQWHSQYEALFLYDYVIERKVPFEIILYRDSAWIIVISTFSIYQVDLAVIQIEWNEMKWNCNQFLLNSMNTFVAIRNEHNQIYMHTIVIFKRGTCAHGIAFAFVIEFMQLGNFHIYPLQLDQFLFHLMHHNWYMVP